MVVSVPKPKRLTDPIGMGSFTSLGSTGVWPIRWMPYSSLAYIPIKIFSQLRRIAILEEDRERLVQNYDELQEFALQDTVTVDGVTMQPQWGPTKSGPRPVLRLPVVTRSPMPEGWSSERIFTRVVPGQKHTSMLVHVREGYVFHPPLFVTPRSCTRKHTR